MRTITGNNTNYISNKKKQGGTPISSTKNNSSLDESTYPSNTGGGGLATPHYTKVIDALWDCQGLDTLEEVIMLTVIIKQAYFKGTNVVQLSYSILSKYLKKKGHVAIDRAGQGLVDKGYITKTFCLGQANMYRVNIGKIEEDLNIDITDYYPKWKIKVITA